MLKLKMKNMVNIWQKWKFLPQEIQEALKKAFDETTSKEDFISEIMIGACPICESNVTRDCDEVDGIQDITIGLCMAVVICFVQGVEETYHRT